MKSENGILKISKGELDLLVTVASSDECRINLYAIAFDTRGVISSTDGHRMILGSVGKLPEDVSWTILRKDKAKAALRRCLGKQEEFWLSLKDGKIRIEVGRPSADPEEGLVDAVVMTVEPEKVTYPPVFAVFDMTRNDRGTAAYAMDVEYLDAIMQFASCGEGHKTVYHYGPKDPLSPSLWISTYENTIWRYMLMPVRGDEPEAILAEAQVPAKKPPEVSPLEAPASTTDSLDAVGFDGTLEQAADVLNKLADVAEKLEDEAKPTKRAASRRPKVKKKPVKRKPVKKTKKKGSKRR